MKPMPIGILGCGNISSIYLKNLTSLFPQVSVEAVADIIPERAAEQAEAFSVKKALSPDELIDDPGIELILNLTIPAFHATLNTRILSAGKHSYSEKPFALDRAAADEVLALAKTKGLATGSAPDTFLGGGLQTCRKLIDSGTIGEVTSATAFMCGHGPESWHPDPEFFYKQGGGPLLDMGPYYVTALVHLLGPVAELTAMTGKAQQTRTITSEKKNGTEIPVEISTHSAGLLRFQNGAIATMITSFDVWKHHLPLIEIHGTKGSLSVPDPNHFGGPVRLFKEGQEDFQDIEISDFGFTENSRGLGLAEMVDAIDKGRAPRASGELARHVLEVMLSFEDANAGSAVQIPVTCHQPEPFNPGPMAAAF